MTYNIGYEDVTATDAAAAGLVLDDAFVFDGWAFGSNTTDASNGTTTATRATYPSLIAQFTPTTQGVFLICSEASHSTLVVYKSTDGFAAYSEVLREEDTGYADGYPSTLFDGYNGHVWIAEYGDTTLGSRLWHSSDGGETFTSLFRTAGDSITHFHGGIVDPATGYLYLFTGDSGIKQSILVCDDVADLIANPATWRTRWGLDDATRSTLDTDYILGYNNAKWRTLHAVIDAGYMYFGSDTNSGVAVLSRVHLATKTYEQITLADSFAGFDPNVVPGEVWFWAIYDQAIFVVTSARDDTEGGNDYAHLFILSRDRTMAKEIFSWERQTSGPGSPGIPHRIDMLDDMMIVSGRYDLDTKVLHIWTHSTSTIPTYPTYDGSADTSSWFYGLAPSLASGGVARAFNGTAAGWMCLTTPLLLQPGTYYITELGLEGAYTAASDLGSCYFAIFEDDAGTLTPITFSTGVTYIDQTAEINRASSSSMDIGPTTVDSVSFTIESGKSYQMAWGLEGLAGRTTSRPAFMRMADGAGPQTMTSYVTINLPSFPLTHVGDANTALELPRGYMKFTTAVRKLFSQSYSAAADFLVPRRTDGDWCIKFDAAVVADGNALTVAMDYDNAAADGTRTTLVLDMGVTDQVTFGGANVALEAAGAEAGDTIDMLVEWRADGKADLFYENLTTGQGPEGAADFTTISHAVKNGAARGTEYTIAQPYYLKVTGTASVSAIEVGWEPILLFGDSQLSIDSQRLGYHLPTAFTNDRIYWEAWIADNKLTASVAAAHTAGYLRYKSTTPGVGDLCEMVTPVFVFGSYGVNDISTIGTTETNRNKLVGLFATRMAEILDDLQDRDIPTLIIGLPPYSDGNASTQEAKCIQNQLNPLLEGLAIGMRCAYLNPWWDMVDRATANDAIPTFAAAYTSDAGAHYNATGCQLVCNLAVRAFESKRVGGPWVKRNTRGRYPGLLLPL